MVDHALLEQVLGLDESARRELRAAIDDSLGDGYMSPEIAAIIDQRIADADANPDDYVTLDEFEREARSRRHVAWRTTSISRLRPGRIEIAFYAASRPRTEQLDSYPPPS